MIKALNIKIEYRLVNDNGIKDFPIYFLTHWNEEVLESAIKNALKAHQEEWNKEEMLTCSIFKEFIQDEVIDCVEYGIEPIEEVETIIINLERQQVNNIPFSKYILI